MYINKFSNLLNFERKKKCALLQLGAYLHFAPKLQEDFILKWAPHYQHWHGFIKIIIIYLATRKQKKRKCTLFPSIWDRRLIFPLISDSVNLPPLSGEELFLFKFTSFGLKAYAALQKYKASFQHKGRICILRNFNKVHYEGIPINNTFNGRTWWWTSYNCSPSFAAPKKVTK